MNKKILCYIGYGLSIYLALTQQALALEGNITTSVTPNITETTTATTKQKNSRAEVEKFLADAKTFVLANGKEVAFKAFMDPNNSRFRKGNLYVFALDFNGICLAHIKAAIVGANMLNLKDQNGTPFILELMNVAKNNPNGGWTEYMWQNPETKQIEKKYSFAIKADDNLWIGAGLYESETK